MTGPACGNNPNHQMSDGDRRVVEDFKAYLVTQAAVAKTLYGFTPLPEIPWEEAPESDRLRFRRRAAAVLAVLPAPPGRAEYDALVAEADRLRRDGAALHAKAVNVDTQLAELQKQVAAPVDRAAVLREAAAAIEAQQAREETTEWAQDGGLDHDTEIGGGYVRAAAALLRRMADETQPVETAELLALATVLEIPRPGNALPLQLRRSYGHADRWAICDREGRRWDRELSCWVYEAEGIRDEALRDATRFTLAEAVPLARKLAAGARQDGAQP